MGKAFFEVFPELKLGEETSGLLAQTTVARVTMTPRRDLLRVYLESEKLIQKSTIYETEQAIADQLFSSLPVAVRIIEKFHLSGQYTASNLYPLYEESILLELKTYSSFLYNLFRVAKKEFLTEDTLRLTMEENVITAEKEEELFSILEKIFCERCGQHFKVEAVWVPATESEAARISRLRMEQEVSEIEARLENGGEEEHARGETGKGSSFGESAVPKTGASAKSAKKGQESTQKTAGKHTDSSSSSRTAHTARGTDSKRYAKGRYNGALRRSDNPDVLYGRDFEGDAIPLEQVVDEMGEVVVRGMIQNLETREIRGEKTIIILELTDFTDSIVVKLFARNDQMEEFHASVQKGIFVKVKGLTAIDRFDGQLTVSSVAGIKKIADFRKPRMDTWPEKRVELHCHTKMSDMDGVTDVKDLIACAKKWGHPALAITDHGAVQAFPDAYHAVGDDDPFKVIYGMEGYLVDDLTQLAVNEKGQSLKGAFVVFDLETTGFSPVSDRIIEIGAVRLDGGKITEKFSTFVNPREPIPLRIEQLTGINDSMVMDAPAIETVLPEFLSFAEGAVLVAHNASFDVGFIREACKRLSLPEDFTYVDTVALARLLLPQLSRFKLDTVARALGVSLEHHHRAVDDAGATAEIFEKFVEMLEKRDVHTLTEVNALGTSSPEQIKKMTTYHVILLATSEVGRVNLYRLVSWSHLTYYNRRPRIPKSVLNKYREGLLIGSACEAGEIYQAILRDLPEQELARLVDFYDYLEVQPIANNLFLTRDEKDPKTVEDLKNYNRRIVELGEQYNKPVVATCDVHFLNPEDEIYRHILLNVRNFKDSDEPAPLYLRTTEEMLEEFSYLGEEKAREIVITNTVKIASRCEKISPVRPDKCPPVIENSDQILTEICYRRAHEIYGEDLPEIVKERLDRELHSIISNGFAVMYIIAQKLVWKSNADGYLVGSRGSVGSSFVATMAGITEVNPLPPHYYCRECHYSDFTSKKVRAFAGMAGCDMPDEKCPVCGKPMKKEGFDIPFETFLGFKGNKEPDIDLNFSGEYQAKAHKYTEVIFGAGQTFRAGTIGTVADKTAYGYVKKYFESNGINKRPCEINRMVAGCVGVRRTTGQHPGGIIVLPYGEEIYSFTPVQHPANDMTTDIVTTHFDYHSIDHNLLKLDILGHDDPTMIRMLEDLTGVNAREIPLDDQEVMSLFQNTKALKITPEDIGGCKLGSLGIPEFGTEFAMQMLLDTKPKYFSDLVRIAGLAHGTDVWLGNAQTLIEEGKATISTAICTRDDIMIYLIEMGLDSELAFTIMESVRKGKGLKPEWEEEMAAHGVPDWYIWSCKKIKYMFPKAHAAAYVMMAFRIAWFKINHPLAYYAAYFSIRAPGFDYEKMCMGKERLLAAMLEYERRSDTLSKKEQDEYKDMKVVREMYARGFSFTPIDLYTASASRFQIVDGKLMPSLSAIVGMGDKAAVAVVEAAKNGRFLSKDDFRDRTHSSKTLVDQLCDLGILKDLPESNQLSLFDLVGSEAS